MEEVGKKRSRSEDVSADDDEEVSSAKNPKLSAARLGWVRSFPDDSRCQNDPDLNKEIGSFRSLGTFAAFPPTLFQSGAPVNFRQPLKVGEFSIDSDRRFHNDASAKKFYAFRGDPASVSFDLKKGYETFVKRDENEKEFVDFVLRWIVENGADLSGVDFVCWRGLLTKLLTTPFENREGWIIAASKLNGTWFLDDFETEGKKLQKAQMTEEHKEMTYWGYKFEQYVTTSGERKGDPVVDVDAPVNNLEGYCRVVKTKLNDHSLMFAGETDCLDENATPAPEYVELKTSREFSNARQNDNFLRFKALKFWAQSFLLGIPTIVCGFRGDDGVVRRLETMKTLRIPHAARAVKDSWSGDVCLRFVDAFLGCVKKHATSPDPRDVVLFAFEPRKDIVVWRCPKDSKYVFLPDWFIERGEKG